MLFSSDWNGTLSGKAGGSVSEVRSLHTMSHMIALYVGEEQFQEASKIFKKQTAGEATMQEAFGKAEKLSKGITLRQAINYALDEMTYMQGFNEFVDELHEKQMPFVINSTGYSVTMHVIKAQLGDKLHGFIGNYLIFGQGSKELDDSQLEGLVFDYVLDSVARKDGKYDSIATIGRVDLELETEDAKAEKIQSYAKKHFNLGPRMIIHMGDTFGDSGGIYGVAKAGGFGVAFNFNSELENFLKLKIREDSELKYNIFFIDPRGPEADLKNVLGNNPNGPDQWYSI
tara:strand:- start:973 stop:1830 length:858 start_codon:yes stop_codon:yes gene_type:complete